jgi:hypothetical protein
MGSKMRASKLRRVVGSIRGGRGYDADQSAVWREVDDHLHRTGTASPTSSYTDSHTLREREIESRLPEIEPRDGQIGIAALHGDVLVGLDVFGSTAVFKRAWPRLARGILGDVLEDEKATTRDAEGAVRAVLACLGDAQLVRTPAARGATLHGSLGRHAVGAVVDGGRVFHVTVG